MNNQQSNETNFKGRTLKEVMERIRPYREKAPERLQHFYHAVSVILGELPEGHQLRITDCCQAKSVDLFRDLAILCIYEEPVTTERGSLEFLEDMITIRRGTGIRKTKPLKTFIEKLNEHDKEK